MKTSKTKLTYKDHSLEIEYFSRPGKGKTILYLHGGACSKEDFVQATQLKEFENDHIVAFDFPGCGNSPYPKDQAYDIDDLVEITKLFIKKLHLKNIILIGHSMGGLIALLYTQRHNNVTAFINVEGNLAEESCLFSKKIAKSSFDAFSRSLLPDLIKECETSPFPGLRVWGESLEKASPKAIYDISPSLVEYSTHGDLVTEYINLSIPKIYIYGSETKKTLLFLSTLKKNGCETEEIPSSYHFLFHDNPKDFYRAVSNFLEDLRVQ